MTARVHPRGMAEGLTVLPLIDLPALIDHHSVRTVHVQTDLGVIQVTKGDLYALGLAMLKEPWMGDPVVTVRVERVEGVKHACWRVTYLSGSLSGFLAREARS